MPHQEEHEVAKIEEGDNKIAHRDDSDVDIINTYDLIIDDYLKSEQHQKEIELGKREFIEQK